MTIHIGRKAWEQMATYEHDGKPRTWPVSVTKREGEQVMVDLSLPDYEIRRDKQTSGRAQ